MLVPPFRLARKELGAVVPIAWQFARAVGGDARAAGQQWGRSTAWTLRMLPLLVAAVWRLLLHGLAAWLCSLAIGMAGDGVWGSLGAMETTVRGCSQRQERSAELLRFGLIWDVLTDRSAAWCARVEVRACDRAATGVARGAPWRSREWSAAAGWALLNRAMGLSARVWLSAPCTLYGQ